jgi:hypothetical protein
MDAIAARIAAAPNVLAVRVIFLSLAETGADEKVLPVHLRAQQTISRASGSTYCTVVCEPWRCGNTFVVRSGWSPRKRGPSSIKERELQKF